MNMENVIARRVRSVPPSGIRKFFDIASQMEDAISLGVGEPDFVTPWPACEAAIYSLEKGHTHYTSNRGMPELREEIARYLAGRFQLDYDPDREILVTVGASEAIDLALRAILEPGDEVLVPEPAYVSYVPGVAFNGGKAVRLALGADTGFRLTPGILKSHITPRTKAIILSYPNNPTGAVLQKEDLAGVARVLADTDIIVISDEIYAELTYEGKHVSLASMPGMRERTIVINGFSKAFAMTGWRLGYAAGNRELIGAMVKIHQYSMLCAPIVSQAAALEMLRFSRGERFATVEKMVREYNRRRRVIVNGFNAMGLSCFEPLGAFYAFPSIASTGMSSEEFCEKLLAEQKVAAVPGTAFGPGGEGHIRCSYATSLEQIKEALRRIEAFVQAHS